MKATILAALAVTILFHSDPEPLKVGTNQFQVMVKEGKQSVKDADVVVRLDGPGTSNAPRVRTEVPLRYRAGGIYRGSGAITSPGEWNAVIVVRRGGQEIGTRQLALVTKPDK